MHSTMHLYPIDGAAHRVDKSDTAFSLPRRQLAAVFVGVDPDPANNERITSWTKDYWAALHPYSAGGRLRELHDGRGPGARQGDLPRQLRAAGRR